MTDKNGVEIKTGNIVEITGAYFKSDNGLYFVESSPGDPNWCGKDYSLHKIGKSGKISTAKHHICFWPIGVYVSDRFKSAEARRWNREHATIEVKTIDNMAEVVARFREKAEVVAGRAQRAAWDFGEGAEIVREYEAIQAHYEAVARSIG